MGLTKVTPNPKPQTPNRALKLFRKVVGLIRPKVLYKLLAVPGPYLSPLASYSFITFSLIKLPQAQHFVWSPPFPHLPIPTFCALQLSLCNFLSNSHSYRENNKTTFSSTAVYLTTARCTVDSNRRLAEERATDISFSGLSLIKQ